MWKISPDLRTSFLTEPFFIDLINSFFFIICWFFKIIIYITFMYCEFLFKSVIFITHHIYQQIWNVIHRTFIANLWSDHHSPTYTLSPHNVKSNMNHHWCLNLPNKCESIILWSSKTKQLIERNNHFCFKSYQTQKIQRPLTNTIEKKKSFPPIHPTSHLPHQL
jgi:hypothetical protein